MWQNSLHYYTSDVIDQRPQSTLIQVFCDEDQPFSSNVYNRNNGLIFYLLQV